MPSFSAVRWNLLLPVTPPPPGWLSTITSGLPGNSFCKYGANSLASPSVPPPSLNGVMMVIFLPLKSTADAGKTPPMLIRRPAATVRTILIEFFKRIFFSHINTTDQTLNFMVRPQLFNSSPQLEAEIATRLNPIISWCAAMFIKNFNSASCSCWFHPPCSQLLANFSVICTSVSGSCLPPRICG